VKEDSVWDMCSIVLASEGLLKPAGGKECHTFKSFLIFLSPNQRIYFFLFVKHPSFYDKRELSHGNKTLYVCIICCSLFV
jgi:hypothetical protein